MAQAHTSASDHTNGRAWIVYPLLVIQIAAATWLGQQWEPAPDVWAFVLAASISTIFPATWLFDKPSTFRELWAIGMLLQMFGVMIMAMTGVLLGWGLLERLPTMGVSFFVCAFGLIWMVVYLILFGASRLINLTKVDRANAQHSKH
jgi:hypothetical protein